jgi:hypothetical protein
VIPKEESTRVRGFLYAFYALGVVLWAAAFMLSTHTWEHWFLLALFYMWLGMIWYGNINKIVRRRRAAKAERREFWKWMAQMDRINNNMNFRLVQIHCDAHVLPYPPELVQHLLTKRTTPHG